MAKIEGPFQVKVSIHAVWILDGAGNICAGTTVDPGRGRGGDVAFARRIAAALNAADAEKARQKALAKADEHMVKRAKGGNGVSQPQDAARATRVR